MKAATSETPDIRRNASRRFRPVWNFRRHTRCTHPVAIEVRFEDQRRDCRCPARRHLHRPHHPSPPPCGCCWRREWMRMRLHQVPGDTTEAPERGDIEVLVVFADRREWLARKRGRSCLASGLTGLCLSSQGRLTVSREVPRGFKLGRESDRLDRAKLFRASCTLSAA